MMTVSMILHLLGFNPKTTLTLVFYGFDNPFFLISDDGVFKIIHGDSVVALVTDDGLVLDADSNTARPINTKDGLDKFWAIMTMSGLVKAPNYADYYAGIGNKVNVTVLIESLFIQGEKSREVSKMLVELARYKGLPHTKTQAEVHGEPAQTGAAAAAPA